MRSGGGFVVGLELSFVQNLGRRGGLRVAV